MKLRNVMKSPGLDAKRRKYPLLFDEEAVNSAASYYQSKTGKKSRTLLLESFSDLIFGKSVLFTALIDQQTHLKIILSKIVYIFF